MPGGAREGAGRPAEVPYMDAPLLELLTIHTKGATSAELAVYIDQDLQRVRDRLTFLVKEGVLERTPNPMDHHEFLYGLPSVFNPPTSHLTVQDAHMSLARARVKSRTR